MLSQKEVKPLLLCSTISDGHFSQAAKTKKVYVQKIHLSRIIRYVLFTSHWSKSLSVENGFI